MGITIRTALAAGVLTALAAPAMAQDITVGVSIPAATHGWAGGMNFHAQQAIERLEEVYPQVDLVLATASDPAEQVSDIEDMVATRGIDALVVLPFESEPLTGPVQAVAESGVWITVVDRGLSVDGIEDLYVAGDNAGFGRVSGEFMASALPEGGKIVALRGIPTTIDNMRVEGFEAAIEGKNIEVLGMEHGNWNRDDSFTVMQDFLSRFPEIDAVWASDDDMAVGVLAAIEAAGRDDVQFVLGGAGMKEMIARTRDNDPMIPANVTYPPAMIATAIELTVVGQVSSAPVAGTFTIGSELVTPENAAEYYFPDSPF
ncbi:ABC transporter substrate-binding protein [Salipiger marinus]|jgi:ribose transport system substrate-binding protein|uniref:Monosaccharide ABC transporter substrate-binding protein, CUT2 family (TC 3.A.1.2.-) n=1 Tax=Salipiger marinus TaxID=555512 RepID=A0A1G8QF36_9RHOB|nr:MULTISPECIES: ABC transporter substrate-binding protein [Salipiger]MCD1617873.1 ABC transporter substrate-binding protein [Salipiger manganoxidans]MEB3418549.1 ABC transporter substrate-binding protein [Salipiger manganoxidans]SDJ03248.1 monosaccharide ABC transporter substrate-binding protein, CUT2 family (TC 3.A.1.2.-) [Salipiger marinus]HBT00332.1 ABC transporter substrate-binding protein [Citreicella sp.]